MTLNTVTVEWDETDIGQAPLGGYITFRISEPVTNTADGSIISPDPARTFYFVGGSGQSDPLVASDNTTLQPAGSYYTITVVLRDQPAYSFKTTIDYANGATQHLGYLLANAAVPAQEYAAFLPLPTGTPQAGQVPVVVNDGQTVTEWGNSGAAPGSFSQPFTSQSSVTVTHNLGKYPSVTVLDTAGDQCEGDVDQASIDQLTVTFSAPFSGTVYCN